MNRKGTTIAALTLGALGSIAPMASAEGFTWGAWYDRLNFKGDFRYRYESIEDHTTATTNPKRTTDRQRIRLRFGLYGAVNQNCDFGFRLATDKSINSTNQTLETGTTAAPQGAMSIGVDQAFATLGFKEKTRKATFGRMANPFYCPNGEQLVWDGDFTPDGIAFGFANKEVPVYATAAAIFMDSSRQVTDAYGTTPKSVTQPDVLSMLGLQVGYKKNDFNIALSYFDWGGIINAVENGTTTNSLYSRTTAASSTGAASAGAAHTHTYGSATTTRTHCHDYNILELASEYAFKVGEAGKFKVFGDLAKNNGTEDNPGTTADNPGEDMAWMLGVEYKGEALKLGVNYRVVEQNAILASYNDSDFGGGGTDAKGWKPYVSYSFWKNTEIGATYFMNKEVISRSSSGDITAETNYRRLQVDLLWKI